jgi:hypothetical protein
VNKILALSASTEGFWVSPPAVSNKGFDAMRDLVEMGISMGQGGENLMCSVKKRDKGAHDTMALRHLFTAMNLGPEA